MKKVFIFIIFLFGYLPVFGQSSIQETVVRVMNLQENAWNNYDLSGFMQGYWHSDSLQFITRSGITYGWENMLHHYIQAYPDKVSMGILEFSQLQIKELSSDYCFVSGNWQISRKTGVTGGSFTLLFKKMDERWQIVIDHTD